MAGDFNPNLNYGGYIGHGSANATDIIIGTINALSSQFAAARLDHNSMDSFVLGTFMKNWIVAQAKEHHYAQIYNFPRLDWVDANGGIVSRGKIKMIDAKITIGKQASVLEFPDMDYKAMIKGGSFGQVPLGIANVNIDSVLAMMHWVLNNLSTGKLKTYNNETPAQVARPSTSAYVDANGVNRVPNLGAVELSNEGIMHVLNEIASHKDLDDVRYGQKQLTGIIVDYSQYFNAVNIVSQLYTGTSNERNLFSYGLRVGAANLKNPKNWIAVTDNATFGLTTWSESTLPYVERYKTDEEDEQRLMSKWYVGAHCLDPYGFYSVEF